MSTRRCFSALVALAAAGFAAAPALAAPPDNDTCGTARIVPSLAMSFTDAVLSSEATFDTVQYGVWWEYTPAATEYVTVLPSMSGDGVTTLRARMYTGTCQSLGTFTNLPAAGTTFLMNPGTTYRFVVGLPFLLANPPANLTAGITLTSGGPAQGAPINDTCEGAIEVTGSSYTHNVPNWIEATSDQLPVSCSSPANGTLSRGVWYKYTSPSNPAGFSRLTIRATTPSAAGKLLAVVSGTCEFPFLEQMYSGSTSDTCFSTTDGANSFFYVTFDALSNNTYYILLAARSGTANPPANPGSTISIDVEPGVSPPVNDTCATTKIIPSLATPYTDTVNVGNANADNINGYSVNYGAWWEYTPTISEYVSLTATHAAGSQTYAANDQVRYILSGPCGAHTGSGTRLNAGTTYRFNIGLSSPTRYDGQNYVLYPLTTTATIMLESLGAVPPPPSNDLCGNATVVSSLPFEDQVSIGGATSEFSQGVRDIWYVYTAPTTHTVAVKAQRPRPNLGALNLPFVIFTGDCSNLTQVANSSSYGTFEAQAGTTYFIRLQDGIDSAARADDVVNVSILPVTPMTNDTCAEAIVVNAFPSSYVIDNTAAMTEPAWTLCDQTVDAEISKSIYFRIVPPSDGELAITGSYKSFYSGTCASPCFIGSSIFDSAWPVQVLAGEEYILAIGQRSFPYNGSNFNDIGFVFTPSVPACPADFNHVNGVTVQDIFDFLTAWLAGSPSANFNGVNGVTVQDIFDFLTAWLAGC